MLRGYPQATLRCGNQLVELDPPVVMGILNITPDSFYAPSRSSGSPDAVINRAGEMIREGARILDVGGMSTRPGASQISEEEEKERVVPVMEALHKAFPDTVLSIDTYRASVAHEAIQAGATMINDISGGQLDPALWDVAATSGLPYVLMHMRGTPADMQQHTYYEDLIGEVVRYFVDQLHLLHARGIRDIVLDPGFGFAKSPEQNFMLIDRLGIFGFLGLPVMIGVSRKSTLSRATGRKVEDTLHATTALHMAALERGASILRVHDVGPAIDAIAIFRELKGVKTLNNKRL